MSGISESFSSGVAFQYSAVGAMYISSTFFYFFIAHILPVSIVGSISLLYAIMNIMAVVFVFGLSAGIQHYLSYHIARENHRTVFKLIVQTTIFGILLAIFAFVFMYFASHELAIIFFHSTAYTESIKIIGVAIAGSVLINIFGSILLGLKQYKKYSIVYIFINIVTYFFPLTMLFLTGKSVYLIAGLASVNILSASLFGIFVLKASKSIKTFSNTSPGLSSEKYKNIIMYSFPLFIASIMGTSATYIDRIVVSYFISLSYLGIYNFALIVASAATFLVVPVSNLLIPKLSSFFSLDDKAGFRESIRILLNIVSLIYIPAALGIAALSRPILLVFAGPAYVIASGPLMIIMFVTSLFIGATVLTSGISSIRKTRIFLYSSGMALTSNILLSIILIPRFNIMGAAVSYSSMNAVNFYIVYHYAKKFGVNNFDVPRLVKIWISSLIMFAAVFVLQGMFAPGLLNIFLCILAGTGIYIGEIKIFRLISSHEMDYVLSVIPERFSFAKYIVKSFAYNENSGKYDRLFRFIK